MKTRILRAEDSRAVQRTTALTTSRLLAAKGERWTEVWDKQMQTITYRTDKQQGPTVGHRELYSIFYDKP